MNSTIKQFAELSKSYKTIVVDGQMQSVLLIDPEKFAKMIIEECLSYTEDGDLDFMKFMIKKNFGVE
jgi:hypothetical protein